MSFNSRVTEDPPRLGRSVLALGSSPAKIKFVKARRVLDGLQLEDWEAVPIAIAFASLRT